MYQTFKDATKLSMQNLYFILKIRNICVLVDYMIYKKTTKYLNKHYFNSKYNSN